MALDGTYPGLLASLADWLHRANLSAQLPDFVSLAEARMSRNLRLRRQWTTATIVFGINVQSMPLPADWLEMESVYVQGGDALEFKSPGMLGERTIVYISQQGFSYPDSYSIEGSNLTLPPDFGGGVTLQIKYRTKLPTVIGTTGVQTLLADSPGLYLWGSLAEAAPFVMDDERVSLWESKYQAEEAAVREADQRAEHSGAPLRMRAR